MHNPLSKEAREMVWGSLIGDGGVFKDWSSRHCAFKTSHSPKQEEYIKWKYELLKPVMSSRLFSVTSFHKIRQKEYTTLQFVTKTMSYFSRLRNIFYPEGKKVITRNILNRLTPLGLATWYMDDGGCTKNNRNYPQANLYSCGYTLNENLIIQEYFKEVWGIETKVHCRKKHPHIYFNRPNALKLVEIIKPYIVPSMLYKIRYFSQTNSYPQIAVEDIV